MRLLPSHHDDSASASSLVQNLPRTGTDAVKTVARRWLLKTAVEEAESFLSSLAEEYRRTREVTVVIDDWEIRHALLAYLAVLDEAPYDEHYQAILTDEPSLGSRVVEEPSQTSAQSVGRVRLAPMPGEADLRFDYEGHHLALRRSLPGDRDWGDPVYELVAHSGGADAVRSFLQGAIDFYADQSADTVDIYHSTDDGWRKIYQKRPRPLSSVILSGGLKSRLRRDMESFLDDEDWYVRHGIPWRRGYLFHGPPGTGKSSVTEALAGHLDMDLYSVSLSNGLVSDSGLQRLFQETSPRSVILIEEVDRVYDDDPSDHTVSIGGLLNCLDGVTAPAEGRIVIMTTNHYERLGEALLRDGRSDVTAQFDLATPEQARNLFLKFFPEKEMHANTFMAQVPAAEVAPSEIQGHLRQFRGDPDGAAHNVDF